MVDGREAGYLSFEDRSQKGIGVVYDIVVLPAFQGHGVGNQLLARGELLARERGCRWLTIGLSEAHMVLVVSHTEEQDETVRIISARSATRKERRYYEEGE